jgi:hypothetical protein
MNLNRLLWAFVGILGGAFIGAVLAATVAVMGVFDDSTMSVIRSTLIVLGCAVWGVHMYRHGRAGLRTMVIGPPTLRD